MTRYRTVYHASCSWRNEAHRGDEVEMGGHVEGRDGAEGRKEVEE